MSPGSPPRFEDRRVTIVEKVVIELMGFRGRNKPKLTFAKHADICRGQKEKVDVRPLNQYSNISKFQRRG